jgi:uncharacterized protein (TIGR02246 family)
MRSRIPIIALAAVLIMPSVHLAAPLAAQRPDGAVPDPEIRRTVERMFDAMRARDTAALRAVFDSSARLVTTFIRDGKPAMRSTPIERFVQSVGAAQVTLDERIYDVEVRQDDNLATVWTRYTFYAGERLSHCGYDAFQLYRAEGGWKVFAIADTQRREGCTP